MSLRCRSKWEHRCSPLLGHSLVLDPGHCDLRGDHDWVLP